MTLLVFFNQSGAEAGTGVVTLLGVRPPVRADELPWTQMRLEEAPGRAGAWQTVELFELVVDEDPKSPAARDFTSSAATIAAGWFRAVWIDEAGREEAEEAQLGGPPFMCSIADVARVMRGQVKNDLGGLVSTFSTSTTPTADEVEDYIADAADFLVSRVGEVAMRHRRLARHVCALRAAMLASGSGRRGRVRDSAGAKELAATFREELETLLAVNRADPARQRSGSVFTPTPWSPR